MRNVLCQTKADPKSPTQGGQEVMAEVNQMTLEVQLFCASESRHAHITWKDAYKTITHVVTGGQGASIN